MSFHLNLESGGASLHIDPLISIAFRRFYYGQCPGILEWALKHDGSRHPGIIFRLIRETLKKRV